MARYIDANKLKEDVMSKSSHLLCEWDTMGVLNTINSLETADVRPERHERWKGFPDNAYIGSDEFGEPKFKEVTIWHCSYCNRKTVIKENYCPHCGAKMDGDEKKGKINERTDR